MVRNASKQKKEVSENNVGRSLDVRRIHVDFLGISVRGFGLIDLVDYQTKSIQRFPRQGGCYGYSKEKICKRRDRKGRIRTEKKGYSIKRILGGNMIPQIGLMVGLYIMTRMFQLLLPQGERRQHVFVTILAGITIVVTVFVIADLFIRGASLSVTGI
jgi:hypothetical protein